MESNAAKRVQIVMPTGVHKKTNVFGKANLSAPCLSMRCNLLESQYHYLSAVMTGPTKMRNVAKLIRKPQCTVFTRNALHSADLCTMLSMLAKLVSVLWCICNGGANTSSSASRILNRSRIFIKYSYSSGPWTALQAFAL